jgi:hypothetical protein
MGSTGLLEFQKRQRRRDAVAGNPSEKLSQYGVERFDQRIDRPGRRGFIADLSGQGETGDSRHQERSRGCPLLTLRRLYVKSERWIDVPEEFLAQVDSMTSEDAGLRGIHGRRRTDPFHQGVDLVKSLRRID